MNSYPDFYDKVPEIVLYDPLSDFLGARRYLFVAEKSKNNTIDTREL